MQRYLAAATVVVFAAPVSAIPIVGQGALGAYEGELSFTASSATSATLMLTLVNTSPAANGGFLTAFVLNNPHGAVRSVAMTNAPSSFELLALSDGGVNAAPSGKFDFGVSTGRSYEGGGKPQAGLGVGQTAMFTFTLTGVDFTTLTTASFLSELSSGNGSGGGAAALSARFRGFTNGGSDKVAGAAAAATSAPQPAPLPNPVPPPAPTPDPAPTPAPILAATPVVAPPAEPMPQPVATEPSPTPIVVPTPEVTQPAPLPVSVVDWPVPVTPEPPLLAQPVIGSAQVPVPEPGGLGLLGLGLLGIVAARRRV